MSKNTGTSELINYFDLGANGDIGIAGSLDINTIANATTDTDTFLVSDTGIIKYRTGAQLLSDIGAQGLLTNPVTGTGTSGTIPVFTGSTTIGNSIIQSNATQVNVVGNGSQLLFDSLGSAKDGGIQYVNDFTLQMYNSRGVGSSIYLGNNNLDLNINPSSNPRLRITSGGNVLINSTTDNGARLQVSGTATFSGALNGTSITLSGDYNSTTNSGSLLWTGSTNKVQLNANAGTLDFYTGTSGYTKQLSISPSGAATFSSSVTIAASTFLNWGARGGISQDGSFNFNWSTNGVANAFHLQSATGNVGIGTTNPVYTLHAKAASGSTTGLRLESSGGTTNFDILSSEGDGNAYLYQRSNYGILIGTNNTLRMTITSGGNVLLQSNQLIGLNTSDGSDTGYLAIAGGGGDGINRAGHIYLSGNERVVDAGNVVLSAGNVSSGLGDPGAIIFRTAGSGQMKIAPSGNVLIGTTTDTGAKLNVGGSYMAYPVSIEAGAGGNQLALTRSGAVAEFYMGGSTGGGTQLYVRSGGSGGVRLDAGSTGWVSASDIRLKDVTKPIQKAVESLSSLQTIYYSWKDSINKNLHIGLIAQEVEKVFPELVSESSIDGMKGVNYTELIPVIIKAIQELNEKINK